MGRRTTSAGLRAGAGEAEITPGMGIQIAGDIGRYRPTEEVRDPLFAKALVLECGGRRACWLSMDLLVITRRWADEIRRRAAAEFDIAAEAILVHVTQTHSAPSVGHHFVRERDAFNIFPKEYPWLLGGDDRYAPVAVEGALAAIRKAAAGTQPVRVRVGRGVDGRIAFNRRFVMRDGTVRTHPGNCDPAVLHCEGPIDPEVGVMLFENRKGVTVAAVLHHTCHPTAGFPQRWISADWPGAWCGEAKRRFGADCVPLVINGFCGNIHHCNHLDPHYRNDYAELGRKLMETTERILPSLRTMEAPVLDWKTRWLKIPTRRPTNAEMREARKMLREHPQPVWTDETRTAASWDWMYAASRLDLAANHGRRPFFDYLVQAFRLGDTALVAVPGEPFVEEQLRIKLQSPATFTFTAHMSNEYVGYIPTEQAFLRGGYETRTSQGSKLHPKALRQVGDASLRLLGALFRGGRTPAA